MKRKPHSEIETILMVTTPIMSRRVFLYYKYIHINDLDTGATYIKREKYSSEWNAMFYKIGEKAMYILTSVGYSHSIDAKRWLPKNEVVKNAQNLSLTNKQIHEKD